MVRGMGIQRWWSVTIMGWCHALLYVRLLWLKPPWQLLGGWADFRYVCCSVRDCVDLFGCWADGVHLVVWSPVRQNLGERRPPINNHSQTAPARERQGCCQIKMHPRPHFSPVPVPLLTFCYQPHCYSLLTTIAPLWGSSDQGLIRIAENFRAEGAKIKIKNNTLFVHFWDISGPKCFFDQGLFLPK